MDLWGAGCVMFEITSLYPLFPGSNEVDQISRIHKVLGSPSPEVLGKFKAKGTTHIALDFPEQKGIGIPNLIPQASPEAVDLVVALTHFREPNDERLAAEAPEIDLVLGGHDHHYSAKAVAPTGTWYVKSGADFKWLSKVNLQLTPQPGGGVARGAVSVEKLEVTGDVAERADVAEVVAHYMDNLKAAMGRELGQLGVELDTRRAAQTRAVSGLRRTAQPPGCGAHAPIAPVPGRRSGLRRCARRRRTGATGWRTSRARAAPRMWRSSTAGRCEQTWCTRRARRVQRAARGAGRRRPLAHQR